MGTMKEKRPDCQLNWKNYSTIVFLEVLKKNCYIGIFTDWTDRTKYNWQEHHKRKTEAKKSTENAPENGPENAEVRIPLEKKDATEMSFYRPMNQQMHRSKQTVP